MSGGFTVIGILNEVPLAPELDTAALVGWLAAQRLLDFDGHPSTVYTRSADEAVLEVRSMLARTANPQRPEEVRVGRLPLYATLGALAVTAAIGPIAGLHPAIRASHLPPTEALRHPLSHPTR